MSSGTGIKTSRPIKHYKPVSGKEVLIYNNSYIVLLLYTWINPISHCLFLPWNKLYLKEGMPISKVLQDLMGTVHGENRVMDRESIWNYYNFQAKDIWKEHSFVPVTVHHFLKSIILPQPHRVPSPSVTFLSSLA